MKKLLLTLSLALVAILANAASTVYLKIDGTTVTDGGTWKCYAWIGSKNLLGEWPGTQMTKSETAADDGNYYFTITIDTDDTYNIIFNQFENASWQTGDITNLKGDVAYSLDSNKNATSVAVPKWTNLTIVGEGASWNGTQFKKTDDGYVLQLEGADLDQLGDPGFVINRDGKSISSGSELTVGRGNGSEGDYVNMTEGNEEKMKATLNSGDDSVFIYVKNEDGQWKIYVTSYSTSGVNAVNASDVKISANGGEIVVEGAQKVAVYTVGGALLSTDARTKVAKGLYIVRADNQVKKVIVK